MNLQWDTVQRIREAVDAAPKIGNLLIIPRKAWVKIHQAAKSRRYTAKRSWQRGND